MNSDNQFDEVPAALRIKFLASLPQRLTAIGDAWHTLTADSEAGRSELRLHVHRLAGATGSYGYADAHASACRLEAAIDAGQPPGEMEPRYLETCFAIEKLIAASG